MKFPQLSEEEIQRINKLQAEYFSDYRDLFEPPLPEGVPERLRKIVRSAKLVHSDVVLDIGAGTGILIPLIKEYSPARIYANDLSAAMLESVTRDYPDVKIFPGDVRDLKLPDQSIDVVFINACYPNLVDKHGSFENIGRMVRTKGRVLISHPMGRSFIHFLKEEMPFPMHDFPEKESVAEDLFAPYGLMVSQFLDSEKLYILVLTKKA